jgi:alpha-ketoglutarate-dependent taurine dioxygenase
MNYHIHENGWTVIVDDFDIKQSTVEDINLISRLIAKYTVVVFKNQELNLNDELRICHMFKNPKPAFATDDRVFKGSAADLSIDPIGLVCRVTGEKNEDGDTGIAGHEDEMAWHNNSPYDPERNSIVWLYSVRGSKGSRTSWNNTTLAYRDLDAETRQKIKDLKCIYFSGINLKIEYINDGSAENPNKQVNAEFTPPLVYTNIANQIGLYLSPYLLENFVGLTKEETKSIVDPLFEFVTQDKYCYHHDWEDGDLVLSEQWLGIHKRWPFKEIEKRLLHRAAFDFPDQDYSQI